MAQVNRITLSRGLTIDQFFFAFVISSFLWFFPALLSHPTSASPYTSCSFIMLYHLMYFCCSQALKLAQSLIVFGYATSEDLITWKPYILGMLDGSHDLPAPVDKNTILDNITGEWCIVIRVVGTRPERSSSKVKYMHIFLIPIAFGGSHVYHNFWLL